MELGVQEGPSSFKKGPSSPKTQVQVAMSMSSSGGANTRSAVKAMAEGGASTVCKIDHGLLAVGLSGDRRAGNR